jgi:hypothetical protein
VRTEILAEEQRTEAAMNDLLSCVHQAGNPYFDWPFDWPFGGAEVAPTITASRVCCSSGVCKVAKKMTRWPPYIYVPPVSRDWSHTHPVSPARKPDR